MPLRTHSLIRLVLVAVALSANAFGPVATSRAQDSGKLVVAHPLGQDDPRIVDLFGGHTLIAWRAQPGTASQIVHAMLLDPTGQPAPGWPAGGQRISPDSFSVPAPFILKLSDDLAAVFWTNRLIGDADGYVAWVRRTSGSVPTAADVVTDTVTARPGGQNILHVVRQDDQHALVAIYDGTTLIKRVAPPGVAGGAWPVEGVVFTDSVAMNPIDLAGDELGGCFVLTQSFHRCDAEPLEPPCPVDLKVHHLLSDGSPDPAWPAAGVLLTDHAGWDQRGWVTSDRLGGAYAAWYDTTGDTLRVRAQHLSPDGQPTWGLNGKELAAASESQIRYILDLDATSAGDLIATLELYWEPHLVALRPDGSAVPGWPAEKRLIPPLTFPDDQFSSDYNTELTPEDWIVVIWRTFTQSTGSNIWGAAVGADGQTLTGWPAGIRAICDAPGGQGRPRLALDADGQTFKVVWEDGRLGASVGEALYYDQFWLADGTVPALSHARLLMHRLEGRKLRATWRMDGVGGSTVGALRAIDPGDFDVRLELDRFGEADFSLADSLPQAFSRARYVLVLDAPEGKRIVSDTLEVRPEASSGRPRLRCASVQRGSTLAFSLVLDRDAENVEISVFDVAGRRVRSFAPAALGPGVHERAFDVSGAGPGLYYVEARLGGGLRAIARVALLR